MVESWSTREQHQGAAGIRKGHVSVSVSAARDSLASFGERLLSVSLRPCPSTTNFQNWAFLCPLGLRHGIISGNADDRRPRPYSNPSANRVLVFTITLAGDLAQETLGVIVPSGEDGIGVVRGMTVDVGDGLVRAVHDLPLMMGPDTRQTSRPQWRVSPCFAFDGSQRAALRDRPGTRCPWRAKARQAGQRTRQPARGAPAATRWRWGWLPGSGVVRDSQGQVQVDLAVDIGVAITVQVLDDRHLGLCGDALDQATAASLGMTTSICWAG